MSDEGEEQHSKTHKQVAKQNHKKAGLIAGLLCVSMAALVVAMNIDRLPVYSDEAGGGQEVESANTPPMVLSVTASSDRIHPAGSCQILCEAVDQDKDSLTYTWAASNGEIIGEGASVTWNAPDAEGLFPLFVTVEDGHGGRTDYSTSLAVKANLAPEISDLSTIEAVIAPGATSLVSCSASDADGDKIAYEWSASGGEVFGEGDTIIWLAPAEEGAYSIQVRVRDSYGAETTREIPINVTLGVSPQLGRFSVNGINTDMVEYSDGVWDVFRGRSVRITCHVVDGQAPFTYEWGADYGTLNPDGNTATWEAPEAKGPATVTVDVTDVDGDTTRGTVLLYVETCTCAFD